MPPRKTEDETALEAELMGEATPVLAAAKPPEGGEPPEVRLHPILSNEEYRKAQAAARVKVDAEKRKAAMKSVEELTVRQIQAEEGVFTGDAVQDEMVDITLELAPFADRLTINGMVYMHGGTYTVSRARANVLNEMVFNGWRHQEEIDGKSRTLAYQRARGTSISEKTGIVRNAPQAA